MFAAIFSQWYAAEQLCDEPAAAGSADSYERLLHVCREMTSESGENAADHRTVVLRRIISILNDTVDVEALILALELVVVGVVTDDIEHSVLSTRHFRRHFICDSRHSDENAFKYRH